MFCYGYFGFSHLPFAAPSTSLLSSGFQSGPCSFHRKVPFHLRQTSHHMEKERVDRGGCIDLIGKGFDMHTALSQVTHDVNQAFYTASQSVEFPHDQSIIFSQDFQR